MMFIPRHPIARGFVLLVLVLGGTAAMGYGYKHHSAFAFVIGVIVALYGGLDAVDFGKRHPGR